MVVSWVNAIAVNYHRRGSHDQARYQALPELCGHVGIDLAPLDAAKILTYCRPRERALFEQQLGGLTTQEIAKKQGFRLRRFESDSSGLAVRFAPRWKAGRMSGGNPSRCTSSRSRWRSELATHRPL
jgi:hypothetical protein